MKKQAVILMLLSAMAGLTSSAAFAEGMTSKAQYEASRKQAATRYAEDKKLCAEETTSRVRLQCLRDAKAEYNQALAVAKTTLAGANRNRGATCSGCGKVVAVSVSEKEGEGGALGMITGGVAGALLGNQVGKGGGRDLATIAGAAGGAYAGHKIEQKMKTAKIWNVTVQYDNGSKNTFAFDKEPGLAVGDLVRNSGESVVRR
jgi:uncharacterized protein YcfJ